MIKSEHSRLLQTSCADGIVAVHGQVDLATWDRFRAIVAAAVDDGDGLHPRAAVQLDLAGIEFIDVGGARVLVTAARERLHGCDLIVYHPPAMLVRIIELGWGKVPNLRFEQRPPPSRSRERGHEVPSPQHRSGATPRRAGRAKASAVCEGLRQDRDHGWDHLAPSALRRSPTTRQDRGWRHSRKR